MPRRAVLDLRRDRRALALVHPGQVRRDVGGGDEAKQRDVAVPLRAVGVGEDAHDELARVGGDVVHRRAGESVGERPHRQDIAEAVGGEEKGDVVVGHEVSSAGVQYVVSQ